MDHEALKMQHFNLQEEVEWVPVASTNTVDSTTSRTEVATNGTEEPNTALTAQLTEMTQLMHIFALSSTKGLKEIHESQQEQHQKLLLEIEQLSKEQEEGMNEEFEALLLRSSETALQMKLKQIKIQMEQLEATNEQHAKSEECHKTSTQELEKQIASLKAEKQQIQLLYDSLAADCKNMEQYLNGVQKEYEEHKEETSKLKENLSAEFHEIQQGLAKETTKQQTAIKSMEKEIEELHAKCKGLKDEKNALQETYDEMIQTVSTYQEQIKSMEAKITEHMEVAMKYEKITATSREAEMKYKALQQKLHSRYDELDAQNTRMVHQREVDMKEVKNALQGKVDQVTKEYNVLKQSMDKTAATAEKYKTALNERGKNLKTANATIEALQQKLKTANEANAAMHKEKNSLSMKLNKCTQDVKKAMVMLNQYQKESTDFQTKCDQLTAQNVKIDRESEESRRKSQSHLIDLQSKFDEVVTNHDKVQQEYNDIAQKLQNEQKHRALLLLFLFLFVFAFLMAHGMCADWLLNENRRAGISFGTFCC